MRKVSSLACLTVGGGDTHTTNNKQIDDANYKTLLKKSPSRQRITKSLQNKYPNDLFPVGMQQQTSRTLLMEEEYEEHHQEQEVSGSHCEKEKSSKPFRRSRSVRSCESLPGEAGAAVSRRTSVSSSAFSLRRRSSLLSNSDGEDLHRQRYEKLQSYIKHQKWNKLLKVLDENNKLTDFFMYVAATNNHHDSSEDDEECSTLTLLHLACEQHPPVEVIECLYRFNPSWLHNNKNSLRQTPLHVAAQYGANPSVIEFLLDQGEGNGCLEALQQCDVNGMTPLELHLEYTSDIDGTCDPSSFTQDVHDYHRKDRFEDCDKRHDSADMMFAEFMTVNAFRTYGPIDEVVWLLEEAQVKETCADAFSKTKTTMEHYDIVSPPSMTFETTLLANNPPAPSSNNSGSNNVFASFLVNTTNPLEMSQLFDPVAPSSVKTMQPLSKPSLRLEENIKKCEPKIKEKKSSNSLFSSSSCALFSLSSSKHQNGSKASLKHNNSKLSSSNSSFHRITNI